MILGKVNMKQIIKFKSPEGHYKANACVVWCFDDRFSALLEELRRKLELTRIDLVKVAGGAKWLSSTDMTDDSTTLLGQIFKSIRLHNTPLVILMIHKNCGAYEKLPNEEKRLLTDLRKAKLTVERFLENNDFSAEVKAYLADFDGLWEVE